MRERAVNYAINTLEEVTIKGRVVCASSNKYTVDVNGENLIINARGKIKYKSEEVLTGDFVEVENGAINKVYPRFSRFIRPNVANVDTLLITISNPPKPDFLIVDKLLLSANFANTECAIVINKCDLGAEISDYVLNNYKFLPVFLVSAKTGEGIQALKSFISGKTLAFAGQSAVGKTSILNALMNTQFRTGEISEKSERGKHTTTGSRMIRGEDFYLFDTPGFSEIIVDITPQDAVMNYPPYDKYLNQCKYLDCTHLNEPDCHIKNLVKSGALSSDRYERYKIILEEIKKDYSNRYVSKKY